MLKVPPSRTPWRSAAISAGTFGVVTEGISGIIVSRPQQLQRDIPRSPGPHRSSLPTPATTRLPARSMFRAGCSRRDPMLSLGNAASTIQPGQRDHSIGGFGPTGKRLHRRDLGADPTIGGYGPPQVTATFNRTINLVGNGFLSGNNSRDGNAGEYQGVISGSGRLIVGMNGAAGLRGDPPGALIIWTPTTTTAAGRWWSPAKLAAPRTLRVEFGKQATPGLTPTTPTIFFGTGDVTVKFGGIVRLGTAAANISDGQGSSTTKRARGGGLRVGGPGFVPSDRPILLGYVDSGTCTMDIMIPPLQTNSIGQRPHAPIGNGYMYLDSVGGYSPMARNTPPPPWRHWLSNRTSSGGRVQDLLHRQLRGRGFWQGRGQPWRWHQPIRTE